MSSWSFLVSLGCWMKKSMSVCPTPRPGEKAWGKQTKVLANVLQNTGTRAASVNSEYVNTAPSRSICHTDRIPISCRRSSNSRADDSVWQSDWKRCTTRLGCHVVALSCNFLRWSLFNHLKARILNDNLLPSTPLAAGHPFHTSSGSRNSHATQHLGNVDRRGFRVSISAWARPRPNNGTGGLRFSVYSVLQTKKAIEKEGGRVNKCVHPDTTVILANWILLAARSATKEMIFWYLLKLHLDWFQVCKSDSQKLSRRKHFCRTKNTGRDSKKYDMM